ncbi:site-2 protease family protein [uncultured Oscillibacter sp.]|uniref:site-2 protease family protein n=1 Tax=uncultured Oscillibacter sp. TaxID=876091 RepID=UPI0025F2FE95|nr:site-2 protease family protein [uncultured Oscillibacter sp.]
MLHYLEAMFRQMDVSSLLDAAARVAAVLLCLTVHELCHGLAALSLGDPTAKSMDRLSLNPLRHIDWLGLLMMFTVGFGWAKPVPVDPRYFKDPKKGMALTALAGPASNFMLAFSLILISKGIYLYADYTPVWNGIYNFLHLTAILSIGLGLFNLLPIPPLDGAKVLGGLLPDRTYFALMRYERYGMLLLLLMSFADVGSGVINRGIAAVYGVMINLIY